MSEEKHHHHLFHHKKEHENQNAPSGVVYSETTTTYGDEQVTQTADVYGAGNVDEYEKAKKEEKHHKHKEHLGELGAVAAGAFALVVKFFPYRIKFEFVFDFQVSKNMKVLKTKEGRDREKSSQSHNFCFVICSRTTIPIDVNRLTIYREYGNTTGT